MPDLDVDVPTPDGAAGSSLHVPDGSGPWPAVIMYPDAGGTRGVFREMGGRLARDGFVVLVPDIYYRAGGYEPFSMATVFTDPDERQRLGALAGSLTPERVAGDAGAFADFLQARPEVADGPIGTTGYCLGGRLSLTVAGLLGARVGAAASFHGGRLAVEDDPASPHHLAGDVRAVVYVGGAENDASFDDEQAERLERRLPLRRRRLLHRHLRRRPRLRGARQPDVRRGGGGAPLVGDVHACSAPRCAEATRSSPRLRRRVDGELQGEGRVDLEVAQQEGALVEPLAPEPAGDLVVALAGVARAAGRRDVVERVAPAA